MRNVLVIVAHPDDESFAMGGTLATLVRQGDAVSVVALSDGVGSRFTAGQQYDCVCARRHRQEQFDEACALLGAVEASPLDVFPDQRADTVPQLTINRAVAQAIAAAAPAIVFTHHVGDLNGDHRRVAEAVLVATRTWAIPVYSMAPEWPARCVGPAWDPTTAWTITETLTVKVGACSCYLDEVREPPHPRSIAVLRSQATEWFMEIR